MTGALVGAAFGVGVYLWVVLTGIALWGVENGGFRASFKRWVLDQPWYVNTLPTATVAALGAWWFGG